MIGVMTGLFVIVKEDPSSHAHRASGVSAAPLSAVEKPQPAIAENELNTQRALVRMNHSPSKLRDLHTYKKRPIIQQTDQVTAPFNKESADTTVQVSPPSQIAQHTDPSPSTEDASILDDHLNRNPATQQSPRMRLRRGARPTSGPTGVDWQIRELHEFENDGDLNAWDQSGSAATVDDGSMQITLGKDGYESVTKTIPEYGQIRIDLDVTFEPGDNSDITVFFGAEDDDESFSKAGLATRLNLAALA